MASTETVRVIYTDKNPLRTAIFYIWLNGLGYYPEFLDDGEGFVVHVLPEEENWLKKELGLDYRLNF